MYLVSMMLYSIFCNEFVTIILCHYHELKITFSQPSLTRGNDTQKRFHGNHHHGGTLIYAQKVLISTKVRHFGS